MHSYLLLGHHWMGSGGIWLAYRFAASPFMRPAAPLRALFPGLHLCPPASSAWISGQLAAGRTPTSPCTNLPLANLELRDNRALKALICSLQAAGLLPACGDGGTDAEFEMRPNKSGS